VTEPDHDPEHVPDAVLDELMVAFSKEDTPPEKGYDFDDPSIDRLLGLGDAASDDDDRDADADDDADDPDLEGDDIEVAAAVEAEPEPEPAPTPQPAVAAAGEESSRKTIVIDHEELPDAVYLDDDEPGERSTVVIGDLDDGQTTQPAPNAGSAGGGMDPRIRARRIANRRAEGRRRLIWVSVASAVVLLVVAAIAIVASPIFDVRDVEVQGAVYTDPDVLQEVIASIEGEPVLLVDTEAAAATLEAVPWVERARVTTDFPHTVRIDIRERRPVAAFQGGDGEFRVIDVEGRVLDVIEGIPIAYPLIVGDNPDTERGQFAGAPYASAGQLVLALPPDVRAITKAIGVDVTTGALTLVLESPADDDPADIEVRLGDDSQLDDKLARLLYQMRNGDGLVGVCSLDVSTAEMGSVPGC
jgi:cell division protein FtsQ